MKHTYTIFYLFITYFHSFPFNVLFLYEFPADVIIFASASNSHISPQKTMKCCVSRSAFCLKTALGTFAQFSPPNPQTNTIAHLKTQQNSCCILYLSNLETFDRNVTKLPAGSSTFLPINLSFSRTSCARLSRVELWEFPACCQTGSIHEYICVCVLSLVVAHAHSSLSVHQTNTIVFILDGFPLVKLTHCRKHFTWCINLSEPEWARLCSLRPAQAHSSLPLSWASLSYGRHFDVVSQKEKHWFHLDLFLWPSAENYQKTI